MFHLATRPMWKAPILFRQAQQKFPQFLKFEAKLLPSVSIWKRHGKLFKHSSSFWKAVADPVEKLKKVSVGCHISPINESSSKSFESSATEVWGDTHLGDPCQPS